MDKLNDQQVPPIPASGIPPLPPRMNEQINTPEIVHEQDSKIFFCCNCGAPLKYKPNTDFLVCEFCHNKTEIPKEETKVETLNYDDYVDEDSTSFQAGNIVAEKVVTCSNCGATPTVNENLKTMNCPYCGSPLIESDMHEERLIRPGYLLPFNIENDKVQELLSTWIKGLWFAPNKLHKGALSPQNLNGIYLPYWAYDAQTETQYTGERGTTYTVTTGSGNDRRTEMRVRWTYTSGNIPLTFNDVMIPASLSVSNSRFAKLGGFDLHNLLKYNESYLRGFVTEKYSISLRQGYIGAKIIMDQHIKTAVKENIGGDQQRINSISTNYSDITFKHIIVPIYVSSYFYKQKLYQFYVNGRTGKISGERPYSWIKIILFSLLIATILFIIYYFCSQQHS